jgi:hypothetical protein
LLSAPEEEEEEEEEEDIPIRKTLQVALVMMKENTPAS